MPTEGIVGGAGHRSGGVWGGAEPPPRSAPTRRRREVPPPPPRPDAGSGVERRGECERARRGARLSPVGAHPPRGSICPRVRSQRGREGKGWGAERCAEPPREGAQQPRGAGVGSCGRGRPRGRALTCATPAPRSSSPRRSARLRRDLPRRAPGQKRGVPGLPPAGVVPHVGAKRRRSGVAAAAGRPAGKTAGDFCSCYAEFNRVRSGCLAGVALSGREAREPAVEPCL